jgi:hypothetical protein
MSNRLRRKTGLAAAILRLPASHRPISATAIVPKVALADYEPAAIRFDFGQSPTIGAAVC